jgi:2-oxoglutarate ferredoxin oxidoreductase subunit beta
MCPHWAITVSLIGKDSGDMSFRERVAGPPRLAPNPPLANCAGCQHPTVGRIIAELLDELNLEQDYIELDGITCSSSTIFNVAECGQLIEPHEDLIEMARITKREHPDKIVIGIQNSTKFDITGLTSLVGAASCGENITIINCSDPVCGPWRSECNNPSPGQQAWTTGHYPLHIAELAATFPGAVYSARGSVATPDDYERSKGYVRMSLQNQVNNKGFSIVDILCLCFGEVRAPYSPYENQVSGLEWINRQMVKDFPLGVFKTI